MFVFMYCINPESEEPIFKIFDQIGKDEEHPEIAFVDGNEFATELLYVDGLGKKRIQVWINSEGGLVKDGYSIISAILNTKTKVDTLVVGIAYSIAGVIALMGRKVEAMDYASLMFHNPYNSDGTVDNGLETIRQSLITAVSSRRGIPAEQVEQIMTATTFYTADKALEAGLIDEVRTSNEKNQPRMNGTKDIYEYGKKIFNKLTNFNNSEMKAIAKALNLNPEASEDAILAVVNKIKNEADEMDALKAKLAKAEEDCTNLKAQIEKMEEEKAEEDKKAKAKAEEDAKNAFKVTAKDRITKIVSDRGLKVDIENHLSLVQDEATLETVCKNLEAIEVVKSAPKPVKQLNSEKLAGFPTFVEGESTEEMVRAMNSFVASKKVK